MTAPHSRMILQERPSRFERASESVVERAGPLESTWAAGRS